MTNIIWKKPDNSIAVTGIFDGSDPVQHAALLQQRGSIPNDWVLAGTNINSFPDWPNIEDMTIDNANNVVADIAKCQNRTKDRIRAERAPLFAAQDAISIQNIEQGKDNSSVLIEKQRLRDLTKQVDGKTDLSQLKNLKGQ